jgi:hypothetical protein
MHLLEDEFVAEEHRHVFIAESRISKRSLTGCHRLGGETAPLAFARI